MYCAECRPLPSDQVFQHIISVSKYSSVLVHHHYLHRYTSGNHFTGEIVDTKLCVQGADLTPPIYSSNHLDQQLQQYMTAYTGTLAAGIMIPLDHVRSRG